MYYNGQIVWDFDAKKPVKVGDKESGSTFAWENIPKNTSCFVKEKTGKIYCPKSIEDALKKLASGELRSLIDIEIIK
jgi:hypothetical protein